MAEMRESRRAVEEAALGLGFLLILIGLSPVWVTWVVLKLGFDSLRRLGRYAMEDSK